MDTSSLKVEPKIDELGFNYFNPKPKLKTVQYAYNKFFPVIRTEESISLNFSVKAYSNAHILFSTTDIPDSYSWVYEIVLGADHNNFCAIRRQMCQYEKSAVKFKNIISGDEWRSFWIRISSKGLIEVGKRGNELPFMLWEDTSPLNIQYFSFSSWHNTAAFWRFQYMDSGEDIDGFEVLSCNDVSCLNST